MSSGVPRIVWKLAFGWSVLVFALTAFVFLNLYMQAVTPEPVKLPERDPLKEYKQRFPD